MQDVVHLEGTLDGMPLSKDYSKGEILETGVLSANFGSGGMLRVWKGRGTLRMPDDGPEPGVWFVTGAGTKATQINGHSGFTIKGLRRLGTYAAATGMGELAYCNNSPDCPGGVPFSAIGTVNGTAFDWGGADNFSLQDSSSEGFSLRWKSGAALFGQLNVSTGVITNGILWMPTGAPDSSAFWGGGAGSYSTTFGGPKKIQVSELRRLGTAAAAPAVEGQLDGCY